MLFKTEKFGTVEIDENNGFYDRINIMLNQQGVVNCGLNISEDLTKDPKLPDNAQRLLDKLDSLDEKARKEIAEDLEDTESSVTLSYIQFHMEELGDDFWRMAFPDMPREKINADQVVKKLTLNAVGVNINEDGEIEVNLDYVINFDYSDELLAVYFDKDGEVIAISHES